MILALTKIQTLIHLITKEMYNEQAKLCFLIMHTLMVYIGFELKSFHNKDIFSSTWANIISCLLSPH